MDSVKKEIEYIVSVEKHKNIESHVYGHNRVLGVNPINITRDVICLPVCVRVYSFKVLVIHINLRDEFK